jgi:hypothetical protein
MEAFTRYTVRVLLALVASLVALAAVRASAQGPEAIDAFPGVQCSFDAALGGDLCAAELAPGMRVEAPRSAWLPHPDRNGFDVAYGETQLDVRFCPGSVASGTFCLDTLRGTKRSELPQIPFLSAFVTREPPLSTVGLDLGANLVSDGLGLSSDLAAMLDPDRKYLIYHTLTSGISAEVPGLDFLKLSSGGDPTTFVVGAEHAFFYFEGEFKFPFGDKKKSSDSGAEAGAGDASSDSSADGSDSSSPHDDAQAGESADAGSDEDGAEPSQDPEQGAEPDPAQEQEQAQDQEQTGTAQGSKDDAPSFAVALDADGGIPFTPLRKVGVETYMKGFEGHLYVRGPVPIATGVELDGTVVIDLDPDHDGDHPFEAAYYTSFDLALGGNGALAVALPFDFVDLSALGLELGDASATAKISEEEDAVVFTGIVTSEGFLSGLPIPIPIRPDARVEAWGRVSAQHPVGSYVHLEGEVGVSLAGLGALLGLPLGDLAAQDAVIDVNAAGVTLSGTTSSQIHPDIASGAMSLTVHVPGDGSLAYVELRGDIVIAGEGLRDAAVRVDAEGMRVNGVLVTNAYSFELTGEFAAAGYRLEGSTTLADPIAANAQSRATAEAALSIQQAILADLQDDLAAQQAALADLQAAFDDAQVGVAAAQAEVNRLQSLVNSAVKSRDAAYASYRSWSKKSCAWYDAPCQATRAANISYYLGRYSYYGGLVGTYSAAKTVALGALSVAQGTLSGIQAQLSAAQATVASIQAQVAASQKLVDLAKAQLAGLPDISGEIFPVVTLILENGIASGRVDVSWNGVALGGGTVRLSNPAEACFALPNSGTMCTPL